MSVRGATEDVWVVPRDLDCVRDVLREPLPADNPAPNEHPRYTQQRGTGRLTARKLVPLNRIRFTLNAKIFHHVPLYG